MRRITLAVLIIGSLFTGISSAAALPPGGTFVDDDGNIHEGYIEAIAEEGITKGCNAPLKDRFCPNDAVTRGQMAAFLSRTLGLRNDAGRDYFDDDDGSVFEGAINRLAASGITSGCDARAFCPDRVVTRGEMAAFLARGYGLGNPGGDRFVDDDSSIFEGAIEAVAGAGISRGCNPPANSRFCPHDAVRRDVMATFLARAEGLSPLDVPPRIDIGEVDVEVHPDDDLSAMADSYPEGTVFLVLGTHYGEEVWPKDNQVFVGSGATLNGQGATYAFHGYADYVVIRGLEITNYNNPAQDGAINAEGSSWIIESNNVHHNSGVGIRVAGGSPVVRGNKVNYNHQLGISADYTTDGLIADNEIGHNNWLAEYAWGWEAGGSKFWSNVDLVVRNNHVHDNHGPGLWSDTNNIGTIYESNTVEGNYASGIMHEVSYDTIIRYNTLRGNGFGHDAWLWGSGILIASSPGAEIYGNYVEGNYNGITLTQQDRSGTPGPQEHGSYTVHDTYVHDNTVVDSGLSGAAQDNGDDSIYYDNNRFQGNDYRGDVGWSWGGSSRSWSSWQSTGNDTTGSYSG